MRFPMRGFIIRTLPGSAELKRNELRALVVGFSVLVGVVDVTVANAVFGVGGRAVETVIRDWLSCVVYMLVAGIVALRAIRGRTHRRSWALFAVGLSLYALGDVLWSLWIGHLQNPPIPSISDGLWLGLYPLSYAGIVGFARVGGQRRLQAGVWLDGIIAGGGLAALGAALVFGPILASAKGSPLAVATGLAYPIGDLVLAALVVGVLALRGWRIDRTWGLLGGGFLLLAVADCMYAAQVANGASQPSILSGIFYFLSLTLLAFAAWQRESDRPPSRLEGWSVLVVPAGSALVALALLIYGNVERLDVLAFGLAGVTLFAAILRLGLAFRDVRGLAEARHQAVTDDLTSLPNRRLFMLRAREAITAVDLTDGTLSVLMLDLDNFKELNDTLGHNAGDALLRLIGPRLKEVLRKTDTLARLGGDEFGILLDPQPDEQGTIGVTEKILHALRDPFEVQGLALRLTASVGIASFPTHARDPDGLLKCADIAMYQAKTMRSGYAFYSREHDTNSPERLGLAAELATALEHDGIEVHFQPKADARSRQITGIEALVRLRRADGRLVPPLEFLASAEHAGLSRALTRKVLELALDQLSSWRSAGYDLHVAVNTTVSDLFDVDFPREVAQALATRALPPEALILEVTESSILSDPRRIGNVLAQLREFGIRLSLDDFGTGYSSLTHLKSLPVQEVKIDRSFVARMCTDATDAAIVHATVQLAHALGIRVVAEGVEDEQTWEALNTMGCDLIQGYVLSRPVPASELEQPLNADAVQPNIESRPALTPRHEAGVQKQTACTQSRDPLMPTYTSTSP
jgi:diguanylate cyclase (GGDEF)-like protein